MRSFEAVRYLAEPVCNLEFPEGDCTVLLCG